MRYQHSWQDIPKWQIPDENQRNLDATIRHALEVGINHIETARGYGTSEVQLGRILPKLPRDRLIVQTKVSPKADAKEFRRQFHQSFANLNLEYVDLLGLHGINTLEILDWSIRSGGCLEEARTWQQQGKVRFIGFSTHAPTEVIVKIIETNQFDYVNLHWYYINQWNWRAIEAAQAHDMGVFIISPSDKGGKLYQPPEKLVELCQPLSPMVFNNLFCLSHAQVHTLSLGAARPTDFEEHLKTIPLLDRADEILPPILKRLEREAIAHLGEKWVKTWQIGLPKLEETPGKINIKTILWLRNLAIAYNLLDYAKMRYQLLGNGGHWFPGNQAEGVENLDLSVCLQHSPYANQIPDLLADAHRLFGGESIRRLSQP
jgi:uncharacterized protein